MDSQLAVYNQTTALLVAEQEEEIKRLARKLMRMTPGGQRLSADESTDLAVYSLLTGLNPFNAECYYMPKVGPIPGIAGYRVKTTDWLMAINNNRPDTRTWEEYRPAESHEADFDPDAGDIAWVCTLKDSISKERWEQRLIEFAERYHKMGATFQEARDAAKEDVGPCPSWSAVGVVKAEEHFSGNVWENNKKVEDKYKPEMWDRNERAKKRAAKGAYRKGFPNVKLPDPEYGEVVEGVAIEVKDTITKELAAEASKPPRSEAQLLTELGYEPKPEPQVIPPVNLEPVEDPAWTEPTTANTSNDNGKSETTSVYQAVVDANLSENEHSAKNALNKCRTGYDTPEKAIAWMRQYRAARDEADGQRRSSSSQQPTQPNHPHTARRGRAG